MRGPGGEEGGGGAAPSAPFAYWPLPPLFFLELPACCLLSVPIVPQLLLKLQADGRTGLHPPARDHPQRHHRPR